MQTRVDGVPMTTAVSKSHSYCLAVTGSGLPARVWIEDRVHSDNSGALELQIFATSAQESFR
jgi:hypothetical protein